MAEPNHPDHPQSIETLTTPGSPLLCDWQEGDSPSRCQYRTLTSFLTDIVDLDELLSACTAYVHNLVRAKEVRIWLYRRGGRRLVSRDFDPKSEGGFRERRLMPGETLPWRVAREGKTYLGGPSKNDPQLVEDDSSWESILVVPLIRGGRTLGVVEAMNRADGEVFDATDARALEGIAIEFGVAIDNAQLYHDTRRRAAERAVLLEVSQSLSLASNVDETLEAIIDSLKRVVNYDAAAIFLLSADTLQVESETSRGLSPEVRHGLHLLVGEGIVGWVAKTGESVIVADTSLDNRYVVARPTTRSEIACPLVAGGKVIGVFNLESDQEDAYTETHLELLLSFASLAAAAIERARLLDEAMERRNLERELAIAREIQTSFLPKKDPEIEGFDIAGLNLPFSEVGGDYFDFIPVVENQLGIAISDVSGKGIPAAILMAAYRASLMAEIRNGYTIRKIVSKVNSLLHESTDHGKFVTAFYGVLDTRHSLFTFVNAGHNPPILRRADGSIEPLLDGGLAIGVLPDSRYEERPVSLRAGDTLLLYTDGVSEAEDDAADQFGVERIEELLAEFSTRTARQTVDAILDRVINFVGGPGELNDDLTLVCIKRLGTDSP